MLAEALTALAAAGGTAVVQAAGKDAWAGFRSGVARWFGRGDAEREQVALERLDRTAAALEAARLGEVERVRADQEASWQTSFETLLGGLDGVEQQRAADELRDLLADFVAAGPPRSDRARWPLLATLTSTPRPEGRRPGRWATSRSATRPAGLPGRLARRWTLTSRAGPAADRPRHRR